MSATAYGGMIYVLYRAAGVGTARNTNMLISRNGGATFSSECVQEWQSNVCPGTSFSIATSSGDVVGAWETKGHLFFAKLADIPLHIKPAPSGSEQRYPSLSLGRDGSTLLTWTKGAGWQKAAPCSGRLMTTTFIRSDLRAAQVTRRSGASPPQWR